MPTDPPLPLRLEPRWSPGAACTKVGFSGESMPRHVLRSVVMDPDDGHEGERLAPLLLPPVDTVGEVVGEVVGLSIGEIVGDAVGDTVGEAAGLRVGEIVGGVVGDTVGLVVPSFSVSFSVSFSPLSLSPSPSWFSVLGCSIQCRALLLHQPPSSQRLFSPARRLFCWHRPNHHPKPHIALAPRPSPILTPAIEIPPSDTTTAPTVPVFSPDEQRSTAELRELVLTFMHDVMHKVRSV